VVAVGFLTTFAVDALQNLIWFGPWLVTLLVGVFAGVLTWVFSYVDVYKQHGGETIAARLVRRRTWGLCRRLWGFSFCLAAGATFVLFTNWYTCWSDSLFLTSSGTMYHDKHPLTTLSCCWKGVGQWLLASFTLGSLSALLGIVVQWLWEDKSAIEPI
jgi:hypothetical protein